MASFTFVLLFYYRQQQEAWVYPFLRIDEQWAYKRMPYGKPTIFYNEINTKYIQIKYDCCSIQSPLFVPSWHLPNCHVRSTLYYILYCVSQKFVLASRSFRNNQCRFMRWYLTVERRYHGGHLKLRRMSLCLTRIGKRKRRKPRWNPISSDKII